MQIKRIVNVFICCCVFQAVSTKYSDNGDKYNDKRKEITQNKQDDNLKQIEDNRGNNTKGHERKMNNDKFKKNAVEKNTKSEENNWSARKECLTGYMTDVQKWVDRSGFLTSRVDRRRTIDLTETNEVDVIDHFQQEIKLFSANNSKHIAYLSLAKCNLKQVPSLFKQRYQARRSLSETVEYITLFGNQFVHVNAPGLEYGMMMNATGAEEFDIDFNMVKKKAKVWAVGFKGVQFLKLRELDLRKCNIQMLDDHLFANMQKLEALYLGENNIHYVSSRAFIGLNNLKHLDLSRAEETDVTTMFESINTFKDLPNMTSLDLSYTTIEARDAKVLQSLSPKLESLSLCYSKLPPLIDYVFRGTSLKYLDLSGNTGVLNDNNILGGIENTLKVFYAKEASLKTFEIFNAFQQLEVLSLENNDINLLTEKLRTLPNLKILDLDSNRQTTWTSRMLNVMPNLKLLSLNNNNINLISKAMLIDFQNLTYISISDNSIFCNCHARELLEIACTNDKETDNRFYFDKKYTGHIAYKEFNLRINQNNSLQTNAKGSSCDTIEPNGKIKREGHFVIINNSKKTFTCLGSDGRPQTFAEVNSCQRQRELGPRDKIDKASQRVIAIIVVPVVVLPILMFIYVFRRNVRYCLITIKNSATLSLINKHQIIDEGSIFNYDVFVSYCNDDRDWVLDYLLTHIEQDCNVSVCLHERDFQVGLSILENIVSCIDRSHSIMLVISRQFLLSQWCQFEMHLAQHRLLETRREDLILVFIEEIPRALRPTTLHYLMLTKTYIVWPKKESERTLFWKRLKRSVLVYRIRSDNANTTIA